MAKHKVPFAQQSPAGRVLSITGLSLLGLAVFGAVLFAFAGTLDWRKAWLFLAVFGTVSLVTALIGVIKYPAMVDARMKKHGDNQKWDTIVVALLGLNTFLLLAAAGFDRRFSLFVEVPDLVSYITLPFTSLYVVVQLRAGIANPHFYSHVRLQKKQIVVKTGPYKIVRHLFYAVFLLFWISAPLALGSLAALIPGLFGVVLVLYRTAREDRFLKENLKGYREYAEEVRYRLIPGIW